MLILIIIIIAIIFTIIIRNPKYKGKIGELKTYKELLRLNIEYLILNDVLIRNTNSHTSQIDHIVLSKYGVFVIETKNYTGWIFGNYKADKWTKVFYSNKYYFLNPLKQNAGHIYALKQLLSSYTTIPYFSIIVFTNNSVFKNVVSNVPVIHVSELYDEIIKTSSKTCISSNELIDIKNIIINHNIASKENNIEHIHDVSKGMLEKQLKYENLLCPNCKIELILRNGKYGQFYGCPNYPRCNFTLKY